MWFHSIVTKLIAFISSIIMLLSGGGIKPEKPVDNIKYNVSFFDYNEKTVLSSQKVICGEDAVPPSNPQKSGTTFVGWSGNYINVNKDEKVRAVYTDEKNVFVISNESGKIGDTVKVLVKIDGKVKTCGFDLTISYDSALKLLSVDDDLDLDIVSNSNSVQNAVMLNFCSASDKTSKKDIIELTFKIKDTSKSVLPIKASITSIKEISGNNVINTKYIVVDGLVKILS